MAKSKTKPDTSKKDKSIEMKKEAMLQQLEKSLGVVTSACKALGIGRSTFYEWLEKDPEFKAKVDDIGEVAVDFAESQLHKQIKDGSTAATIFYLKTKGKHRGFVERVEQDNLNPINSIEVEIIDPRANEAKDTDE